MKEVVPSGEWPSPEAATFAACLAAVIELPFEAVPEPGPGEEFPGGWGLIRWLGGLGLGLVPVAEPQTFAWAGPWIARVRPVGADRDTRRAVVMYGSPGGGVAWDPSGATEADGWEIDDGFVVSALDVALALPALAEAPTGTGVVEAIVVAAAAGEPATTLDEAHAVPGAGLEGDRHARGTGTFPSGVPGSAITLIEAEVCESFEPPLSPDEHRRNVVTRGIEVNGLVGRDFTIGDVRCRGLRLCEPCVVIERYASRPVLRPLVHRGGLRADIVDEGTIRVGDAVRVVES
jgi:MOSC domain-containing protein YiiM